MKKVLALVLAATMILGTVVMASAATSLGELKETLGWSSLKAGVATSANYGLNLTGADKDTGIIGSYPAHRSTWSTITATNPYYLYTYASGSVQIEIAVPYGKSIRADVDSGDVTISMKRISRVKPDATAATNTINYVGIDTYLLTVTPDAGVRDYTLGDWTVELDLRDMNLVYFITGKVAYSDYQEVVSGERYIVRSSGRNSVDHLDGSIFYFGEVLNSQVRIVCNDFVDLYFSGNYDTDYENLRVLESIPDEVDEWFDDIDLDYYEFVATPKFAKDVTVIIDADEDSFIYEYDEDTGDITEITDECDYTSDGWEFDRKVLRAYIIAEEPYEGGNVLESDVVEEPSDVVEGTKPNPGTGAPVL